MDEAIRPNGKTVKQKRKSAVNDPEMITRQRIYDLFERQQRRCALSGLVFENPADMVGDHIVPVALGGLNVMSNIQLVHRVVNAMKGSLPQSEFIAFCRAIAEHSLTTGSESSETRNTENSIDNKKIENLLFS